MLWIDTESGTWGGNHLDLRLVGDEASYYFDDMSDSEISEFGKEHGKPVAPASPHGHDIVRLTPSTIIELAERLTYADLHGKSVRFQTGSDANGPWFKYDSGSGWTAPIRGEA